MATLETLNLLIEEASSIVGSQARLAELMGMHKSHITQMKQGTRAASWRVRGKLRAILGEDPAHAFMASACPASWRSSRGSSPDPRCPLPALLRGF